MKQEKNMVRKFYLAIFAVISLFVVSVLSASASPPVKAEIAKEKITKSFNTPTTAVCEQQAILNEQLVAKVVGTKLPLEAISKFDFKLSEIVKPLDGYPGKVEHVPIEQRSGQPPIQAKRSTFY
jgi:hypothetical protein